MRELEVSAISLDRVTDGGSSDRARHSAVQIDLPQSFLRDTAVSKVDTLSWNASDYGIDGAKNRASRFNCLGRIHLFYLNL